MRDGKCDYDFVEVMACPGGCIGGGGQPKSKDPLVLIKRMQGIYALDEAAQTRQSHHNPEVWLRWRLQADNCFIVIHRLGNNSGETAV